MKVTYCHHISTCIHVQPQQLPHSVHAHTVMIKQSSFSTHNLPLLSQSLSSDLGTLKRLSKAKHRRTAIKDVVETLWSSPPPASHTLSSVTLSRARSLSNSLSSQTQVQLQSCKRRNHEDLDHSHQGWRRYRDNWYVHNAWAGSTGTAPYSCCCWC